MKSSIIVNVENIDYIKDFKKVGISTFLFALTDYCVGYPFTFSLDEIENVDEENKYILINRVLDCNSVDNLKKVLSSVISIKGIFYEDIAVYNIVRELNLDVELISFQNHFNSNTKTVNFWLDRVDSAVICNELTKNEIENICNNAIKPVVLQVYGHNQIMYSRRLLLSNFSEEFNLDKKNTNVLVEKVSKIKFRTIENNYGTVLYSGNIFNGFELLNINNVKLFYVNTTFISHEDILKVLENLDGSLLESDRGFLDKETIYRLKGDK